MLISHLIQPLAPKLLPEAPTMCEMLAVSNSLNLNLLCISKDMTLFMAAVSKSVLILVSKLLFANT